MQGVRPCPYCGGEVEVIKLVKYKRETRQPYRIQCYHCKALVARGEGFPIETLSEAEERIKQYNDIIAKQMAPKGSTILSARQKAAMQRRIKAGMLSKDDEAYEIHEYANSSGHLSNGVDGYYDT